MSTKRSRFAALVTAFVLTAGAAAALDAPLITAPKSMFRAHRERFLAKLPPGSVAVLHAAPTRVMSNDTDYPYRQGSDFYWLTGLEEPDATAVFRPGATDGKKYVLFVRPHEPRVEAWQGPRPGPEGAISEFGADAAFANAELENALLRLDTRDRRRIADPALQGYLVPAERLYVEDGGDSDWAEKIRAGVERLRGAELGPSTTVDARSILHELRLVKDSDELALMRRSAELSARGHVLAMAAAKPGRYEFEVQQALDSYCFANGARRMAYPSIVASGPNSVFLHWEKNDRRIQDGDVVLNDSGTEYEYYASDVTRTYPANGRFTKEQRAIYEIVLAAQKAAIGKIRAGALHDDIEQAAARVQTEGLVRLGLLSGDVEKLIADRAYSKLTLHGVSHWVGLDVHDPGRYRVDAASRKLEPGMVLTVEPGIYIPAKAPGIDPKWWNIGVRIEDTLAVTATGSDCLSCAAPKEIADVERAVGTVR
ncbi:MAG TPA: aminopeptidase P N-terminal domain-containing protein [Thermoanaerobaculia bacterium]|nr:aminopeptidase P N-terminal domain-containing protein [Thermoanaerobaculia bacterium]